MFRSVSFYGNLVDKVVTLSESFLDTVFFFFCPVVCSCVLHEKHLQKEEIKNTDKI